MSVDDNHGMKVAHFAQLDKDTILLCAESEWLFKIVELKLFIGHFSFCCCITIMLIQINC